MSADESYASLDLSSSGENHEVHQSVEETDKDDHVVGRPPSSTFEDTVSPDDSAEAGSLGTSGSSEYKFDIPTPEPPPIETEPEKMPELLIQPDALRLEDLSGRKREKFADVYMQLFLSSALCSVPLGMREGFEPDEINRILLQQLKISLDYAVRVCCGDAHVENLANRSTNELAHALEEHGWLVFRKGKYFPALDEVHNEQMSHIILGAEDLSRREEKKKAQSEQYPDADAEIKAMRSFNMIVELIKAVSEEHQQNVVQYQHVSTAFEKMVRQEKYENIFATYSCVLSLGPEQKWNNEWFKEYVNRSSLKKFILMSKFSEIVALKNSEFKFRNANVRLFDQKDFSDVRERFAGVGQKSSLQSGNGGQGRRSGDHLAPSNSYASKKKEIAPDPNYKSVGLSRGNEEDDGSLRPSLSSRAPTGQQTQFPEKPGSPIRRHSRSPEQRQSPVRRGNSREGRRDENPQPFTRYQPKDAFGGPPRKDAERGTMRDMDRADNRQFDRRAPSPEITSSESEATSEGSYSDESDSVKAEREARRASKKKVKQEKLEKRKNRPPRERAVDNSKNRFAQSSFPQQQSTSPVQERPTSPSRRISRRSVSSDSDGSPPPNPTGSRNRRPVKVKTPEPTRPAQQKMRLYISQSTHDNQSINQPSALPFHPVPSQIEENKRRDQETLRNNRETEKSIREVMGGTARTGKKVDAIHPGLSQRQQRQEPEHREHERREHQVHEFAEPDQPRGSFGSRRHENASSPLPSQPPPHYPDGRGSGHNQPQNSHFPHHHQQQHQYNNAPPPPQGPNPWINGAEPFDPTTSGPPHQRQSYPQNYQGPAHNYQGPHQQPQYQPQYPQNNPPPHQWQSQHGPDPRYSQYQQQQQHHQQGPSPPWLPQQFQGRQEPNYQPNYPPNPQSNIPPYGYDHGQSHSQGPPPPQHHNQAPSHAYRPPESSLPHFNRPHPSSNYYGQDIGYQQQSYNQQQPPPPPPQPDRYADYMPLVRTPQPQQAYGLAHHNRLNSVVRQSRSGNPNGPRLLSEAIKYEIITYLLYQKSHGQPVFEFDLRGMVLRLIRDLHLTDDRFDIVEFIKREMQITVAIEYNEHRGELQFISRM